MLTKVDRLLAWFYENEVQLKAWVQSSEENAQLFVRDPIQAIRCAGLKLDEDLVAEFEAASRAIYGNGGGSSS